MTRVSLVVAGALLVSVSCGILHRDTWLRGRAWAHVPLPNQQKALVVAGPEAQVGDLHQLNKKENCHIRIGDSLRKLQECQIEPHLQKVVVLDNEEFLQIRYKDPRYPDYADVFVKDRKVEKVRVYKFKE